MSSTNYSVESFLAFEFEFEFIFELQRVRFESIIQLADRNEYMSQYNTITQTSTGAVR
ncbi:MAG: hypothetical protein J07HQW1_03626 [Haloquadratum walsbyi J07HQW1]|jgi:hypothetical protein|uniref:Uncharacterized protein n=1 Tax=Haloquadratum walsbyi J07HQW1 TaxID=1238424 RepID=U1PIS9_9EURY|nr:MAG: hypothetical protein J07HQW1_03626 [Haloquadratum walsbyi J07HQW1]